MKKQEASFFKFDKNGKSISGIFEGYFTGQYGISLGLISSKKLFYVGLNNANLKSTIAPAVESNLIKKGSKIKITYLSEQKTKTKGRKVKIFEVMLNGKKLEGSIQIAPAKNSDVEKFFKS